MTFIIIPQENLFYILVGLIALRSNREQVKSFPDSQMFPLGKRPLILRVFSKLSEEILTITNCT